MNAYDLEFNWQVHHGATRKDIFSFSVSYNLEASPKASRGCFKFQVLPQIINSILKIKPVKSYNI